MNITQKNDFKQTLKNIWVKIAKNYDLSVNPNIQGFKKYQRDNSYTYSVLNEKAYNADKNKLTDKLAVYNTKLDQYNKNVETFNNGAELDNRFINSLNKANATLGEDLNNLNSQVQSINQGQRNKLQIGIAIASIGVGIAAGVGCGAISLGTAAVACGLAASTAVGALGSGALAAGDQIIENGRVTNWGAVGLSSAIGGVTGLITGGIGMGVGSAVTGATSRVLAPVLASRVGQTGTSIIIGSVSGGITGGILDTGTQLLTNGGNLSTINYSQVGISIGSGIAGGAVGGGLASRNPSTSAKDLVPNQPSLSFVPAGSGVNIKVGRWMSPAEYQQMVKTGLVQESYSGTTHVASPADPLSYLKQTSPGQYYVQFDVPSGSIVQTGKGWAKILGPTTIESRLQVKNNLPPFQTPPADNINLQYIKNSNGTFSQIP